MSSTTTTRAGPKNRTHYLYIAVIVAVALGMLVGLVAPGFAESSSRSAPASST